MKQRLSSGLDQGLQSQSVGKPRRVRIRGPVSRTDPMPYPEGASLYLGRFTGHALLTREGEAALARRIEEGERTMLRALLKSRAGLRELAALGRELKEGRLRARDILRGADEEAHDREEASQHLAATLERAGALARAAEDGMRIEPGARHHLLKELERTHLHRRVLDRMAGALRAAPAKNKATQRALEGVEEGRRIADIAKTELVLSNIGLVVSFAKRQAGRGLPLHDLIQEGNIGLMRAADKFDFRRGIRFSTYAAWWIRQQLTRALLEQGKTIRIPVHLAETRQKVRRVERMFEHAHGRAPTEEELGEQSGLWPDRVRTALALPPDPISLDLPTGEDREARLGDFVPDRNTAAPDEQVASARMREQAKQLLETLSPREQEILRRRFGFGGAPEQTLAEIGASLSISRERVRQIEAEALRKLRAPSNARDLASYLAA